jgi:MoaA/NifB/PqqE/SkfB family radical SAM enzyme
LYAERLGPIIRKYPSIKLRFSLEGSEATNNRIRGEKDGFRKKISSLLRLKELGGTDLGFATTIQDDNAEQLVELFYLCEANGLEFSTSTLHNGFQFHKNDNIPYNRLHVARQIERLVVAQLRTRTIKNWFRAYLNLGLIAKVLGQDRLLPCTAGTDFVFVDPWSDVYGCNVRPDLKLGNLRQKSWNDLLNGPTAKEIRVRVSRCKQNCWMVGSAKTAMRNPRFASLPKRAPLSWVLKNKLRLTLGKSVPFEKYVDYSRIYQDHDKPNRCSFLNQTGSKRIQSKDDEHYIHLGEYVNR